MYFWLVMKILVFSLAPSSAIGNCDFEHDDASAWCDWENNPPSEVPLPVNLPSDSGDWALALGTHGMTTSALLPYDDHTFSNTSGKFLSFAALDPSTQSADFISPVVNCSSPSITFWFYLSSSQSVLNATLYPEGGGHQQLWSSANNQSVVNGNWTQQHLIIPHSGPFQIVFQGTIRNVHDAMALDDITFPPACSGEAVATSTSLSTTLFPVTSGTVPTSNPSLSTNNDTPASLEGGHTSTTDMMPVGVGVGVGLALLFGVIITLVLLYRSRYYKRRVAVSQDEDKKEEKSESVTEKGKESAGESCDESA